MLSVPHLVILFVIALLVFGPEKLPELARMLGKAMAEFRRVTTDVRRVVEDEMRDMELKNREADLRRREAELAAEREKSILPPGGGATQAAAIMAGDTPPEGNPSDQPEASAEGVKGSSAVEGSGEGSGGVEGTVQSDRPNKITSDLESPAAVAITPDEKGTSDADAHRS
jgi:sec-independent protein translocase protein TatB